MYQKRNDQRRRKQQNGLLRVVVVVVANNNTQKASRLFSGERVFVARFVTNMNWRKIRLHFSNSILYISKNKTRESVEYTSTHTEKRRLGMLASEEEENDDEEEQKEARRHRA